LGPIFPELNVIPVDRKNADRSALMGAIRVVKNGGAVLIFPEGTRSPDGNLQPAQPGLGMIVAKTGAPVVPVRILGSYDVFNRDMQFPKSGFVNVAIGKPVDTAISPGPSRAGRMDYLRTSQIVMQAIEAL
jgi:1-acyl-sn-glycerol-3-phosphate acyltransferase